MTFWNKVKNWFKDEPDTLINTFREIIAEDVAKKVVEETSDVAAVKKPRKPRVKKSDTVTDKPTLTSKTNKDK